MLLAQLTGLEPFYLFFRLAKLATKRMMLKVHNPIATKDTIRKKELCRLNIKS